MNAQIRQVYGLFVVLFALLIGFTSYWAVLDANGLENNPDNRRALIKEQSVFQTEKLFLAEGAKFATEDEVARVLGVSLSQ